MWTTKIGQTRNSKIDELSRVWMTLEADEWIYAPHPSKEMNWGTLLNAKQKKEMGSMKGKIINPMFQTSHSRIFIKKETINNIKQKNSKNILIIWKSCLQEKNVHTLYILNKCTRTQQNLDKSIRAPPIKMKCKTPRTKTKP